MMENLTILKAVQAVLESPEGKQLTKDFGMNKEQMENFMFAYYMARRI